jgi:hypothetical protein
MQKQQHKQYQKTTLNASKLTKTVWLLVNPTIEPTGQTV